MMRYLIVTADDFGYCEARNRGVVASFLAGGVTRSSLLVMGAAAEQAVRLARQHRIPLGLHFNVTEGLPVSTPHTVPSLLTRDKLFKQKTGFREAVLTGTVVLEEVRRELRAQISYFRQLTGHLPQHVDGHNHIHVLPGVCAVMAEVLEETGVYGTRMPNEFVLPAARGWLTEGCMDFYRKVVEEARHAADVFRDHQIQFSDGFVGMTTMGKNMSVNRLRQLLSDTYASLETVPPGGMCVGRMFRGSAVNCDMETDELKVPCEAVSCVRCLAALRLHSDSIKACASAGTCCHGALQMNGMLAKRDTADKNGPQLKHDVNTIHLNAVMPDANETVAIDNALGTDVVVVELMVHPGYPCMSSDGGCGVGPDDFAQSRDRQHEMEVLQSLQWRTVCRRNHLKLVARVPGSQAG